MKLLFATGFKASQNYASGFARGAEGDGLRNLGERSRVATRSARIPDEAFPDRFYIAMERSSLGTVTADYSYHRVLFTPKEEDGDLNEYLIHLNLRFGVEGGGLQQNSKHLFHANGWGNHV